MSRITAKLFTNGRSQAVRLPKEFRMPGDEVEISREGDMLILKPIRKTLPTWDIVMAELDALPPVDGFLEDRNQGALPSNSMAID